MENRDIVKPSGLAPLLFDDLLVFFYGIVPDGGYLVWKIWSRCGQDEVFTFKIELPFVLLSINVVGRIFHTFECNWSKSRGAEISCLRNVAKLERPCQESGWCRLSSSSSAVAC